MAYHGNRRSAVAKFCKVGRPDRGKPCHYARFTHQSVVGPRFIVGSTLAVARLPLVWYNKLRSNRTLSTRWRCRRMQQPARTRFAVVTVAITAVLLGVAFLWLQLTSPSDGARLDPSQPVWRPDGIVVTPLQEQPGGLRQGDEVVCLAGGRMGARGRARFHPRAPRPPRRVGPAGTYTSVRRGPHPGRPVTLGS